MIADEDRTFDTGLVDLLPDADLVMWQAHYRRQAFLAGLAVGLAVALAVLLVGLA